MSMSMTSWPASSPMSMPMDIEFESVSSLERAFCSNFTCCGELHADLHALIAHHEAAPAHAHPHLRLRLRLAAAPQPPTAPVLQSQPHSDVPTAPPSPSTSFSSSSSRCSSQPDSPITPFDSPLHGGGNPKDTHVHVLPDDLLPELEYPTYEHCYHAAVATTTENASALFSPPDAPDSNPFNPSPPTKYHLQLHTELTYTTHPLSPLPGSPATFVLSSSFAREQSVSSGTFSSGSSSGSACARSPSPSSSPSPTPAPVVKPRTGTKRKAPPTVDGVAGRDVYGGSGHRVVPAPGHNVSGSGGVKRRERGKAREKAGAGGRVRVRGREKLFACPTPGCTKSYLNPNGLKYHLDKGTCVLEDTAAKDAAVDVYPVVREAVDVYPSMSTADAYPNAPAVDTPTNASAVHASSSNTSAVDVYPSTSVIDAYPTTLAALQDVAAAPRTGDGDAMDTDYASASASSLMLAPPGLTLQYPSSPDPHCPTVPTPAPVPHIATAQPAPNMYQPRAHRPLPVPRHRQRPAPPPVPRHSQMQSEKHQNHVYHPQPQPTPVYRARYLPQAQGQRRR